MFELTKENVAAYLLERREVSSEKLLIQELGGGVSNVVLKVMDLEAGEALGTDIRTPGQIKRGVPDRRMRSGKCMVLKQPREVFLTPGLWQVDRSRVWVERDALKLLAELTHPQSVPQVLWEDSENMVLAITPAPAQFLNLKTTLLAGQTPRWRITAAAAWLAALHRQSFHHAAAKARFGDGELFKQQRIVPYFQHCRAKHPELRCELDAVGDFLLSGPLCLIHGDFSPKNILVAPEQGADETPIFIVDFEVAFYGQPLFDIATLINHLLLKGFYFGSKWRPLMLLADEAWYTYQKGAGKELMSAEATWGARLLGGLLLARIDGQSPVEYLTDPVIQNAVRSCAAELLGSGGSVDDALDIAGEHLARAV